MKKIIIIPVFTDGEPSLRDSDLPKATQGVHCWAQIWNWVSQVHFQSSVCWIRQTGPGAQHKFRLLVLKTWGSYLRELRHVLTHMCALSHFCSASIFNALNIDQERQQCLSALLVLCPSHSSFLMLSMHIEEHDMNHTMWKCRNHLGGENRKMSSTECRPFVHLAQFCLHCLETAIFLTGILVQPWSEGLNMWLSTCKACSSAADLWAHP